MNFQRVTSGFMNQNVLNNLVTNRDLLMDLQRKIASGKEFERASDNVFAATTVLSSNSSLGKIENYLKNIDNARSEIEIADKAILTTLEAVHKTRELTIQGLNATSGEDELSLIGDQLEQIIEHVKELANTKFGSKYLFGGQNTNSVPFTPGMNPGEIQYNGSMDGSPDRRVEIAEGVVITVNKGGDEVFGYYYTDDQGTPAPGDDTLEEKGLLATLITLREEYKAGNQDKDVIRQKLDELDNDMAKLLEVQSSLGGLLERLDITEQIHEGDRINLTDSKSKVQDVDFAKAISDLKFQETALQASLQVSSRIIQPSLLNYMR